jgi:FkbM family methyltransferase
MAASTVLALPVVANLRDDGYSRIQRERPGDRPESQLENPIPLMPDFEQLLENFYRTFLKPGDVAIDCGAHTGRHTLPIARAVAPGGRVFAFEPLPLARAELDAAVAAGASEIFVYPYALADREGEDDFVVAVDMPGYSGLKTRRYDGPTRLERIRVDVRTLDGLFVDADRLDYIKIDAEGGELGILRGALGLIRKFSPIVTFEFSISSLGSYGITVADMAAFWTDLRYEIFDIRQRPLNPDEFIQSANAQHVWDYVALPVDRAQELLRRWQGCNPNGIA